MAVPSFSDSILITQAGGDMPYSNLELQLA